MSDKANAGRDLIEELDELIPQTDTITVGGEELLVTPLRARQFSTAARLAKSIWAYIGGEDIDYEGLLANATEDVIALCSAATDKPPSWVGDLGMDELIKLFMKVLVVNTDFFCRVVLPEARLALGLINEIRALRSDGATSSSSSSPTATATGMCATTP